MIVIVSGLLGGATGYLTAKKRNGNGLDRAQYAAGYAIAFMLVGLFLTLIIDRLLP